MPSISRSVLLTDNKASGSVTAVYKLCELWFKRPIKIIDTENTPHLKAQFVLKQKLLHCQTVPLRDTWQVSQSLKIHKSSSTARIGKIFIILENLGNVIPRNQNDLTRIQVFHLKKLCRALHCSLEVQLRILKVFLVHVCRYNAL